jgi:hypothetical protein
MGTLILITVSLFFLFSAGLALIFLTTRNKIEPKAESFNVKEKIEKWDNAFTALDDKVARYGLSLGEQTHSVLHTAQVRISAVKGLERKLQEKIHSGEHDLANKICEIIELSGDLPDDILESTLSSTGIPIVHVKNWEANLESSFRQIAEDLEFCSNELREAANFDTVRRKNTIVMLSNMREELLKDMS